MKIFLVLLFLIGINVQAEKFDEGELLREFRDIRMMQRLEVVRSFRKEMRLKRGIRKDDFVDPMNRSLPQESAKELDKKQKYPMRDPEMPMDEYDYEEYEDYDEQGRDPKKEDREEFEFKEKLQDWIEHEMPELDSEEGREILEYGIEELERLQHEFDPDREMPKFRPDDFERFPMDHDMEIPKFEMEFEIPHHELDSDRIEEIYEFLEEKYEDFHEDKRFPPPPYEEDDFRYPEGEER